MKNQLVSEEKVLYVGKGASKYDSPSLFCCRVRKMRPQGAYYKYIDKEVWHIFDEAGPEREVGKGNTPKPE